MLGFERKTPICITNCSSSMHVHESRVWVAGLKRRLSVSTFVAASKVTESDRSACCKLKDRGKFSRRVCFRVKPVQPHFTAETAFLSTYICSILFHFSLHCSSSSTSSPRTSNACRRSTALPSKIASSYSPPSPIHVPPPSPRTARSGLRPSCPRRRTSTRLRLPLRRPSRSYAWRAPFLRCVETLRCTRVDGRLGARWAPRNTAGRASRGSASCGSGTGGGAHRQLPRSCA